ncbi:hypothetical protein [Desulfobacter curvatus]|uniref:hypothetical protein n=1 Tax=Desulfobacter curvatus TaxID=2290 RepID=UPI00036F9931|nr:hypothetical protein [Desulfobacter curvatus]
MNPLGDYFVKGDTKSYKELCDCFIDLERYANDGSPSGFNKGIAPEYHPFNNKKHFKLPVYLCRRLDHVQIGNLPDFFEAEFINENKLPVPVHPQVLSAILSSCPSLASKKQTTIKVQPTSSGRTVLWDDTKKPHYIKLHFPKIIGRFPRDLSIYKWLSSLEKSKEFYFHCKNFPPTTGFLYDFGGIFYNDKVTNTGFGTIFREFTPRPILPPKSKLLLPAFSLIARSNKRGYDNNLLKCIIDCIGVDPHLFVSLFISPLLDSYLYLSIELGLIPECNAQNVLFEFDIEELKTRVVFRDLGDAFVDFEVRNGKKLHTMFCSYKSLDGVFGKDIFERRSFAYDFKLSHYIFKPLIQRYSEITQISFKSLCNQVKDLFHAKFDGSESYFGSNDYWYSYPKENNVGRGRYIKNRNPSFR